MTIRAKVKCNSVTKALHWDGSGRYIYNADLSPVYGNNEENKKFYAATPGGKFELNSIISDKFEPGREYFVDFIPVDEREEV